MFVQDLGCFAVVVFLVLIHISTFCEISTILSYFRECGNVVEYIIGMYEFFDL